VLASPSPFFLYSPPLVRDSGEKRVTRCLEGECPFVYSPFFFSFPPPSFPSAKAGKQRHRRWRRCFALSSPLFFLSLLLFLSIAQNCDTGEEDAPEFRWIRPFFPPFSLSLLLFSSSALSRPVHKSKVKKGEIRRCPPFSFLPFFFFFSMPSAGGNIQEFAPR